MTLIIKFNIKATLVSARCIIRISCLLFLMAHSTYGANKTWNGGHSGYNDWSRNLNWSGLDLKEGDNIFFETSNWLTNNNNNEVTTINNITFNNGAGAFTLVGSSITLTGNVTNNDGDDQTINLDMILSGTRTIKPNSGNIYLGGVLSGSGGLTNTGGWETLLTGTNTYTGTTTNSSGYLTIGGGGTTGSISNASDIVNNGELYFWRSDAYSYSGEISGSGNLTQWGSGTLTLSGSNTYQDWTWIINNGTLSITTINNTDGTSSNLGAPTTQDGGTIYLGENNTSGTLIYTGSAQSTNRVIDLYGTTGSGTLENNGSGALTFTSNLTATVDGNKTLTLKGTNNGVIQGVIPDPDIGAVSLTKDGTGIWTLGINDTSVINTYSGGTTISEGTIRLTAQNDQLLGTGTVTISSGAKLHFYRNHMTNNFINNGGTMILDNGWGNTLSGAITNNALLTLDFGCNSSNTFSGIISGSGGITQGTPNCSNEKLTLSGANEFTGPITVLSRPLIAGHAQAFGNNAAVIMANEATAKLDITGYNVSIGSLTGGGATGGNVTLGSATLTIGGDNTSPAAYAGVISGSGSITKTGTGTFGLSGTNTYTGATSVNNGVLSVTGSTASGCEVTVDSGATLEGTGTINGSVTISDYGIIAPGVSSVDTLNTGALTLNSTSVLTYTLGTSSDKVEVTGALTLDGTINVTAGPGLAAGDYTILSSTIPPTNNGLEVGTLPAEYAASISISGNDVILSVVSDPEMVVEGNSNEIVDGDVTPSETDNTHFGNIDIDYGKVVKTFIINNTSIRDLTLSGTPMVTISGSNALDFTVVQQPESPVTVSGSTSFKIEFNPKSTGLRLATVKIENDDPDENPYNFSIYGIGEDEDYSTWAKSLGITLDTKSAGVIGDINEIPVLVRLTSSEVDFNNIDTNGVDVRFSDNAGTNHYAYQITRWDDIVDVADIWVLVPAVLGDNDIQKMRMYYGKPNQVSKSSGAQVFGTANNFAAVLHLEESGNSLSDATFNDNSGTNNGTSQVPGVSGHARFFDGVDDVIALDNNLASALTKDKGTFSFWLKTTTFNSGGTGTDNNSFLGDNQTGDSNDSWWGINDVNCNIGMKTGNASAILSTTNVDQGTWHHVFFTRNASDGAMEVFVDGISESTGTGKTGDLSGGHILQTLGRNLDGSTNGGHVVGNYDEIRVSNTIRSNDWIKFSYENQKLGSTLLIFDQNEGQWIFSSIISLNTTNSGADVSGSVSEFPVLIQLNESNFDFSQAKSNGEDIRFSNEAGTPYPYEIEFWDANNKSAAIWVKVPDVAGNNITSFVMMWGNPFAAASSNGTAVFTTENKFEAVWHFEENGSSFNDATANSNTGTNNGTSQTVGRSGNGRFFDGVDDVINLNASLSTALTQDKGTFSFWMKTTSFNSGGTSWDNNSLLGDDHGGGTNDSWWGITNATCNIGMKTGNDAAILSTTNVDQGLWHYVSLTRNASDGTMEVFVDGTTEITGIGKTGDLSAGHVLQTLGRNLDGSTNGGHVVGTFDEIRASSTIRSEHWIKLSYENQKPGQNLVSLGEATEFLPLSGGSMQGDIDMNGNNIFDPGFLQTKVWAIVTPDFVFDKNYSLSSLDDVESFILNYKHLPGIPSARDFSNQGMDLATMNMRLLLKVEELTLHILNQEKRIIRLNKKLKK